MGKTSFADSCVILMQKVCFLEENEPNSVLSFEWLCACCSDSLPRCLGMRSAPSVKTRPLGRLPKTCTKISFSNPGAPISKCKCGRSTTDPARCPVSLLSGVLWPSKPDALLTHWGFCPVTLVPQHPVAPWAESGLLPFVRGYPPQRMLLNCRQAC